MSNFNRKIQKTQGLQTQAQIIRELEYWAAEKDRRYPSAIRRPYSLALNQFKDYFFKLQKGAPPKTFYYWVIAWRWDFRQVVRFVAY